MITGVTVIIRARPPCSLSSKAAEKKDSTSFGPCLPPLSVVSHCDPWAGGEERRREASSGAGGQEGSWEERELMENGLEG